MNEEELAAQQMYEQQMMNPAFNYSAPFNSGFMQSQQEIENNRQFYMGYEEYLNGLYMKWRGYGQNDEGVWVELKDQRIMTDKAASILRDLIETAINRVVRLGSQRGDEVRRFSYEGIETVDGWLLVEGFMKHGIPVDHLELISYEIELLLSSALNWSREGTGQNFMTKSGHSVEQHSYVMGSGGGQNRIGGDQPRRQMPRLWK